MLKTILTLTAIGVAVKVVRKERADTRFSKGTISAKNLHVINSNHENLF